MKKIAKLSLVAAVAVAGFSTANAQPLEEAIKNVEVSGSVVYRYDDVNRDDKTSKDSDTSNKYKVALNLASKINDDVKFNSRFLATNLANGDMTRLDTQNGGDGNVDLVLSNAYFGYTGIANTTINVGKQGLTTPWTVAIDSDGNEQTGTGILALSTVGPVTLAGAYFNQTNLNHVSGLGLTGAEDIVTVGAIANFSPVTVDAWFLDLAETFESYTLGAKAGFDVAGVKLGADARFTALQLDDSTADALTRERDNSLAKITLTAKAGIVDAKYAFAKTDKEGGTVALDNDALTTTQGWGIRADGEKDSTYHQFVLGVQALDSVHVSANYVTKKFENATVSDKKDKETEIYAQLSYKMSKNLSSYVRYGTQENKNGATDVKTETDYKGRLQVEYTF